MMYKKKHWIQQVHVRQLFAIFTAGAPPLGLYPISGYNPVDYYGIITTYIW